MKFIVTDLTRFEETRDEVCMAGIDPRTMKCVRPLPYLRRSRCEQIGILPGAIMEGRLSSKGTPPPHIEDMMYVNRLAYIGPCSSKEFEDVLESTTVQSISKGFGVEVQQGEKVLAVNPPPVRSIITLMPSDMEIVVSKFDPYRIRLNFSDSEGNSFQFVPINDLGFHRAAMARKDTPDYNIHWNSFISRQKKAYLRVGLTREYQAPDGRIGYWMQINGIYTFPNFVADIRSWGQERLI